MVSPYIILLRNTFQFNGLVISPNEFFCVRSAFLKLYIFIRRKNDADGIAGMNSHCQYFGYEQKLPYVLIS